ncbi:DUF4230 domain-containing protein [Chryseobacterium sp. R2A-55]|uniref:DUF4230 domain-containing protein n=1 Tax=Chryseobacterium sp. R2A-55 TaxID=2744445 RepID=UPI001F215215|nr:DUF4230 domain-containing protein [Chryseobacterium sp. R2A-55]
MKNRASIKTFFLGAVAMLFLFFIWNTVIKKNDEKVQSDVYIIMNQIRKMNKMVVLEQDFSNMQKTKITSQLLGSPHLPVSEKNIITFTKTTAQVSYDLNKMKIDVDSVNKKLIIRELPNPEIKILPSVEINSMDDSFFNRFDEQELKRITQNAKDIAYKSVDQAKLKADAKKQLMENLDHIMVLAKALGYKIEDKTNTFDQSKL